MKCENCKRLELENAQLQKRIAALEARLTRYENPHVPPSMTERKPPHNGQSNGKPGRKPGHEGTTRPQPEPTEHIESKLESCPHCNAPMGEPTRTERRVVEDIPEPQPAKVTEFVINHYHCKKCGNDITAVHPDMPKEGRIGKNAQALTSILKFEDRLPVRKIQDFLKQQYGLALSTGSIYDFTRRVHENLLPEYSLILGRIRNSPVVHADETSIPVNGRNYWIWVFATASDTFVIIRNSRGMKVLKETLTKDYDGTIVCDGWKSYVNFSSKIQRCWAHMLREVKFIAKESEEAVPLRNAMRRLYNKLTNAIKDDTPPETRREIWYWARATMKRWLNRDYRDKSVKKMVAKILNGFNHWFTFILTPGVEPTNNRAERALREMVVQRRIMGTLRNHKGTHIYEVMMTVFSTWKLQEKNLFETLRAFI